MKRFPVPTAPAFLMLIVALSAGCRQVRQDLAEFFEQAPPVPVASGSREDSMLAGSSFEAFPNAVERCSGSAHGDSGHCQRR